MIATRPETFPEYLRRLAAEHDDAGTATEQTTDALRDAAALLDRAEVALGWAVDSPFSGSHPASARFARKVRAQIRNEEPGPPGPPGVSPQHSTLRLLREGDRQSPQETQRVAKDTASISCVFLSSLRPCCGGGHRRNPGLRGGIGCGLEGRRWPALAVGHRETGFASEAPTRDGEGTLSARRSLCPAGWRLEDMGRRVSDPISRQDAKTRSLNRARDGEDPWIHAAPREASAYPDSSRTWGDPQGHGLRGQDCPRYGCRPSSVPRTILCARWVWPMCYRPNFHRVFPRSGVVAI